MMSRACNRWDNMQTADASNRAPVLISSRNNNNNNKIRYHFTIATLYHYNLLHIVQGRLNFEIRGDHMLIKRVINMSPPMFLDVSYASLQIIILCIR